MRSKEVDGAIKRVKRELTDADKREYMSSWFAEDLDAVLAYIEELESNKIETISKDFHQVLDKKMNETNLENKIRDKIKELEEKYVELSKNKSSSEKAELNHEYIEKRSLLESLLGE